MKNLKKRFQLNPNIIFILNILLMVVALTQSLYFLMLSLSVKHDTINYQENGNIDYKVYLKDNDFYETNYLGKDMVYVSSLIKNINTTFNYDFNIDKKSDIDFEYNVIGKIIITDNAENNTFFEKEYTLVDNVKDKMSDGKKYNLTKDVNIDYGYYNGLANKFKKSYGVNTKSRFVVTMNIKYDNGSKTIKLNNSNKLALTIPLSESEVNISLDSSKLNSQNHQITTGSHIVINSGRKLVASTLLGLIAIFLLVNIIITLFELKPRRSKYESLIRKILREYDRLIVNTTTAPTFKSNKRVNVETFQELLDVRDNLKEPIKYYIVNDKECIFYLNHNKEVYVLNIKADELESDKHEKDNGQ